MPSDPASPGVVGPATVEHPAPTHLLLHLSDVHLTGGAEHLYGDVDSEARFCSLLDAVAASGLRPDALVFTGDLADRGEARAYERLLALVGPVADRLGARPVWVMGNHDDRGNLRRGLLGEDPSDRPLDRVHWFGGLRLIALDSSVPGFHHGEVTAEQLDWLASELRTPAPEGTILALHHPPLPVIQPLAALTELRNQRALGEIIEGSDVRIVLAGHQHYPAAGLFAGVPVSVASATCYTQDLTVEQGAVRGMDGGQSFNLVYVYPETVLSAVGSIASFPTVGRPVSRAEARARLEQGSTVRVAAGATLPLH